MLSGRDARLLIVLAGAAFACAPAPEPQPDALVNRVWVAAKSDGLPGKMQVFLDTGVLVSDSCWETYRLSNWRREGESKLVWEEDGMAIEAEIVSLSDSELKLRLALVSETVEQTYQAAQSPFVCPDMPR